MSEEREGNWTGPRPTSAANDEGKRDEPDVEAHGWPTNANDEGENKGDEPDVEAHGFPTGP